MGGSHFCDMEHSSFERPFVVATPTNCPQPVSFIHRNAVLRGHLRNPEILKPGGFRNPRGFPRVNPLPGQLVESLCVKAQRKNQHSRKQTLDPGVQTTSKAKVGFIKPPLFTEDGQPNRVLMVLTGARNPGVNPQTNRRKGNSPTICLGCVDANLFPGEFLREPYTRADLYLDSPIWVWATPNWLERPRSCGPYSGGLFQLVVLTTC